MATSGESPVKKIIESINAAAEQLARATEIKLAKAEERAHIKSIERRRRIDRRKVNVEALIILRDELDDLKIRIERNAKNLETQFARMAEMQVELDRLSGKNPPRFRG
jgi:chromosome segregation ATPase